MEEEDTAKIFAFIKLFNIEKKSLFYLEHEAKCTWSSKMGWKRDAGWDSWGCPESQELAMTPCGSFPTQDFL